MIALNVQAKGTASAAKGRAIARCLWWPRAPRAFQHYKSRRPRWRAPSHGIAVDPNNVARKAASGSWRQTQCDL